MCSLTEFVLIVGSFGAEPSTITFAGPLVFSIAGTMLVVMVIGLVLFFAYITTLLVPTAPSNNPSQQAIPMVAKFQRYASGNRAQYSFDVRSTLGINCLQGTDTILQIANHTVDLKLTQKLLFFLPRVPVPIKDHDQAVALGEGVVTLAFSVYNAAKNMIAEHIEDVLREIRRADVELWGLRRQRRTSGLPATNTVQGILPGALNVQVLLTR